jgi:hypothetical protein
MACKGTAFFTFFLLFFYFFFNFFFTFLFLLGTHSLPKHYRTNCDKNDSAIATCVYPRLPTWVQTLAGQRLSAFIRQRLQAVRNIYLVASVTRSHVLTPNWHCGLSEHWDKRLWHVLTWNLNHWCSDPSETYLGLLWGVLSFFYLSCTFYARI